MNELKDLERQKNIRPAFVYNIYKFTKDQCVDILNAVYTFIQQSGRRL